jgi:hypothetical protein
MNLVERRMLDALRRGRDEYNFVSVKAEFEAEGTRPNEFLRLLELARKAGLKVALKIGGAEAVSDLLVSKLYGVDYIIAPMVESRYALTKYVEAVGKVYNQDERTDTEFLFNLETENTLKCFNEMVPSAVEGDIGVVFGRVDYTLSCGMARGAVDDRRITDDILKVASICKEKDIPLVVGGSVSEKSVDILEELRSVHLTRFETRKVVFGADVSRDAAAASAGIDLAGAFELDWLINKSEYYQRACHEDATRIEMLSKRFNR